MFNAVSDQVICSYNSIKNEKCDNLYSVSFSMAISMVTQSYHSSLAISPVVVGHIFKRVLKTITMHV